MGRRVARLGGLGGLGHRGRPDPGPTVRVQQAYPLAFFDLHLRNRGGTLLDGPSPAFPAVKFLP